MSNIKSFNHNINVKNKRVIIRADFNVPIVNNLIQDTTRIDLCIPLIKELLDKKAKLFLLSHFGRPKSTRDKSLTLKPVYDYIKEKIGNNVYFFSEEIDNDSKIKTSFLKQGEMILFENLRFNDGEIKNDEQFAKKLSKLGEIYINDAFSCSHRKQASVHKITKYVKNSFGGPNLVKELRAINLILNNKSKPVTCIIGGSKVSTKIGVISSLIKKVDNIIIVGAMANNFMKFKGQEIGKSIVEDGAEKIIRDIYKLSSSNDCNIIIPTDFVVSEDFNGKGVEKNFKNISKNEIILDIGPKTIKNVKNIIDNSKTVMWTGPAGYFENKNFSNGTILIARKISNNTSENSLISIVGGGDTVSAIKNYTNTLNFTHLSTAGGAFLEYLEGKNLPGIEVLK